MKNRVEVLDQYSRKLKLDRKAKQYAEKILAELHLDNVSLNILFIGDSKMQAMNREFLNHDYTTDVLSFGQLGEEIKTSGKIPKKLFSSEFPLFIGDVVVCLSEAKRQAKNHDLSYEEEWVRYVCHGVLHLVGYDDYHAKDKKKMWAKQEQIVKTVYAQYSKHNTHD